MKKSLLASLLVTTALFFVACGGGTDSNSAYNDLVSSLSGASSADVSSSNAAALTTATINTQDSHNFDDGDTAAELKISLLTSTVAPPSGSTQALSGSCSTSGTWTLSLTTNGTEINYSYCSVGGFTFNGTIIRSTTWSGSTLISRQIDYPNNFSITEGSNAYTIFAGTRVIFDSFANSYSEFCTTSTSKVSYNSKNFGALGLKRCFKVGSGWVAFHPVSGKLIFNNLSEYVSVLNGSTDMNITTSGLNSATSGSFNYETSNAYITVAPVNDTNMSIAIDSGKDGTTDLTVYAPL